MFDYFKVLDNLKPEERDIHTMVREFVDAEIIPNVQVW